MDGHVLLRDTLAAIEERRSQLTDIIVAANSREPRPAREDAWNLTQIVDHLLLGEGFTNDITVAMASSARDAGKATGFPAGLTAFEALPPPTGLDAPDPIRPHRALTDLASDLRQMQARTRSSFELLATFDPREYSVPHPLFGVLDLGQWWVLQGVHYSMHIDQARSLDDLKESLP